jgi:hypothetical protein
MRHIAAPYQIVKKAFDELWNDKVKNAEKSRGLPQPVLTHEIYLYLVKRDYPFKDRRTLPNALINLATVKNPSIRKVEREGEFLKAWAPAGVFDDELDLSNLYSGDYERIKTAVRRACARLNRPVSSTDVMKELNADQELSLKTSNSLSLNLNWCAKDNVLFYNKPVRRDHYRCVRRIGNYNGKTFYFFVNKKEAAKHRAYVSFLRISREWEQSCLRQHLDDLESCRLPSVAAGRARLIILQATRINSELNEITASGALNSEVLREAGFLQENVSKLIIDAEEWIHVNKIANLNLPVDVDENTPAWTSEELLSVLKPIHPALQNVKTANKVITLLSDEIRRVSNPEFRMRFSRNPQEAALFLFDRTDALLVTALRAGGYECCMQAMLAVNELGYLRDERFVIPALKSDVFEERLSAVACLAFLRSEKGNEGLRKSMLEDPDPNIREAATWAFAFASEPNSIPIVEQLAKTDPNHNVRDFAGNISKVRHEELWKV